MAVAWSGTAGGGAVQIGHGEPAPSPAEPCGRSSGCRPRRRCSAARPCGAVAPDGSVFEPRLVSYYEDVELAGRLRAAGRRALLVPAARARHAGSATGATMSRERWRLIYGNRYLAASRRLGAGLVPRLPGCCCAICSISARRTASRRPASGRAGGGRSASSPVSDSFSDNLRRDGTSPSPGSWCTGTIEEPLPS